MLLDDLVTAIQTVQARIREHANSLSQNEYRTRLALIDPILNALGWDVSDPALVTPEYQAGNGRADYALLGSDRKPKAFIEAKRLNESLDAHQDQVFKYTWDQKVFYGGLTDGNRWVLEDVTAPFSGREGRLLDVTLSRDSAHQCALKFLLLWQPTLASGRPTEANEPILPRDESPHQPQRATPPPAAQIISTSQPPPPPPPPSPAVGWVPLTDYEFSTGDPSPTAMRLPDNREIQIKFWSHVILETAEWLIRSGCLTAELCPLSRGNGGRRMYIVATEPTHSQGRSFSSKAELSNGLFLEKHGDGGALMKRAKFLLEQCNLDPASILLKPGQ